MRFEWLAILALLAAVGVGFGRRRNFSPSWWLLALFLLVATALWAWWRDVRRRQSVQADAAFFASVPREGRPDGYVSSDHCQACHPGQYASWHRTFHRTMTQFAGSTSVVGNFDNVTLELAGQKYRLERLGDEFWVELDDSDSVTAARNPARRLGHAPRVKQRVGLVTGSHHLQVYWLPGKHGNLQTVLPFAWLIEDKRWVPFHQTFLRDPALPLQPSVWNLNCIQCHATGGQPRPDLQVKDWDTRSGELGIACEACHGPGEKHVAVNGSPGRRYASHYMDQGDPSITNPARLPSKIASQVCGQCHGIKWIPNREEWRREGFRFRPGQDLATTTPIVRPTKLDEQPWVKAAAMQNPTFLEDHYWSDGMVRVSGREYNGLLESPCHQRGELSCLSCHALHQSAPEDQLAPQMDGNGACLSCHGQFRTELVAHTHHLAGSPGSECYNCHMPHTTYGLLKAIRSHQIDSPSVPATQKTGRPNACNLCHLDQTLGWTAQHLATWYRQPMPELDAVEQNVSAAVVGLLKGDAGQRALIAFSMGWAPAKQAAGTQWLAPYLAQLLDDPYSAVRYIAQRSLKRLPDYQNFAYDFTGSAEHRATAPARALGLLTKAEGNRTLRSQPQLFIDTRGELQQDEIRALRQQRDNHSMDLQE